MSASTEIKSKEKKASKKRKSVSEEESSSKSNAQESAPDANSELSIHPDRIEGMKATGALPTQPPQPPKKKRKASIYLPSEIEVDVSAPEPPSKRGLRLLKKGRPLPPSKSGAESSPEPEPKKAKEKEKRSEHGIWIGNLPFIVSKEELQAFLMDNSDITAEGIVRIHMPAPADEAKTGGRARVGKKQYNKGFAYVDFSTAEAVTQAIALSEQLLSGRRVLIKNKNSYEGRPEKAKEEQRKDGKAPSKRIFVGNLRYDTTQESLQEHFERCGTVDTCFVATFEDSGKCKGYGWVTFQEIEAAEAAVKGYVLVPIEEAEDEIEDDADEKEEEADDDKSDSDKNEDSDDDKSEIEEEKKPVKKTKPRLQRWFVSKLHGRPLRIEFAEDPQTRYKKRYGKEGTKAKSSEQQVSEPTDAQPEEVKPVTARKVERRNDWSHRLTGEIVQSQGKKVVF